MSIGDWHDFTVGLMRANDEPPSGSTAPVETDPILEALAGYMPGAEGNVLTETASDVAPTKNSVLPQWAHDIKIAGFDPEQPEMFVWTGDSTKKIEHTTGTSKPIPNAVGGDSFHIGEPTTTYSTKDVTKAQTITQAANLPYTWDDDEIADAMEKMNDAGLEVESFDEMVSVWEGLVDRAAKTFIASEGEKKVTPWDVLDMTSREIESINKAKGIEKELDQNRRETFTQRSVQDISEGEAWSVLQSNLSNLLGRDPSDDEVRDFTYRMNALAARNPAISKTITQYKNGEAVSQVTNEVDSGLTGDDIMQTAYEDAQSNPEYAEYQASSVYFNALMSGLGAMGA